MMYFNKRNGKVAKLVSHDDKFKTSILEFEDGSTVNITDATIKRWYKVMEEEVTEEPVVHKLVQMPGTEGDWGKEHWGAEESVQELAIECPDIDNEELDEIKQAVDSFKVSDEKASKKKGKKDSVKKGSTRKKKEMESYVQDGIDFICGIIEGYGDEIFIPAGNIKMKAFKVGGHMYCKFTYSCSVLNVAVQSKAMPSDIKNPDKIANHLFNSVYTFDSKLSGDDKKLIKKLLTNARNYRIEKNERKVK